MNYSKNAGYGQLQAILAQNGVSSFGKVLVVVEDSDTANYQRLQEIFDVDNDGSVRFFSTLNAAYTAATSNAGDVILMSANSSHTITPFVWSKNRINVIGLDGGDRLVQQGTKVQNVTADTAAYVLKVTGVRNSFRNIKFIQNSTNAAALSVVQMGGEGNLYKNCSFAFGVIDNLDQTDAFEVICGEDSGTFIDCTFGADTLLTSAARAVMSLDMVTANQEFKSNRFRGCTWIISSSSSTATHIRLAAVTDILFANVFENPVFVASVNTAGGAAIAESVQTGTGVNKGTLVFTNPCTFSSTDFATATGGRNAGIQIVGTVTTAGTSGIGVQPTA